MNGEQLTLFKQPVISRKLDDHLLVPKKIETFMILYIPLGGGIFFINKHPKVLSTQNLFGLL